MHVYSSDARWEKRVPNPVTGLPLTAVTEESHRRNTLNQMQQYNVVAAVVSTGTAPVLPLLERWRSSSSRIFIPAIAFDAPTEIRPEWIRTQHAAGRIRVIGEIGAPYAGYSGGDASYEPFFALAEELDVPIAVHAGSAGGQ